MNERQKLYLPRRNPSRLPARVRWTLRGLVILPPLTLVIASGFYFSSLLHLINANLAPIAEAEITRQSGHEVQIGTADLSHLGIVTLTDIAVSNKATFAAGNGEATLRAKRLTVAYNLHSLLFDSGNAAHAVGDVTLEQPALLVERFATGYNFSDFFKPKTTKTTKPFVGRIIIHDGLLRFRDFDAPDRGKRPALNTLAHVEATVDLGSERTVYFQVQGRGDGVRFGSLALTGDVSRTVAGRYRGHVAATDADAAYWTDYFKAFPQARVIAGRADADVTLAKLTSKPAPGLPLDLSGHIVLRGVTVAVTDQKIVALPLKNIFGSAAFTSAGVSFESHLSLAGVPLEASGTVFDFAHAQVAVKVKSDLLDPTQLGRGLTFLKLPGGVTISPGPALAQFTGPVTSPTITLNGIFPAVSYAGNHATDLSVQAFYSNKALTVSSATFRVNNTGLASLQGTVDLSRAKPLILAAGTLRGVDLKSVKLPAGVGPKNLDLGGLADAQFLADNSGRPLSVAANFAFTNLRVMKTNLRSATGRVAWTQGQPLTIAQAIVRDSHGAAALSGTLPAGTKDARWNLSVRATGLDISGLLRPYTKVAVGGLADFDGKIIGLPDAPQAQGRLRLMEPRYGRYAADLIGGQVDAGMKGVQLTDVTLRRFPTEARVDGSVSELTSLNPKLNLKIALSQGDIQDFLHLAEQASDSPRTALTSSLPNLTGTAEGVFRITGGIKSPVASGQVKVTDATVGSYRIDLATADLHYGENALSLENVLVKSGRATLTAHGQRTDRGVFDAEFALDGLELGRFHKYLNLYADVDGTLHVTGHFGGTLQSPHVAVQALTVPNLIVDGQTFAPFSLAGRYDDGILTQTGSPWRFVVSIPRDYAPDTLEQVEYRVDSLRLTLPTAAHPKRPSSLVLTAAIPTSSPERLPHVLATISSSRWAQTTAGKALLIRMANLPQPLNATVALPKFTLSGPLNSLSATGELSANNMIFGDTQVKDLTANFGYSNAIKPIGHLNAQASDLIASGVPIGAVSADVDYRDRTITVHQLHASSERAFLNLSGTANLDGEIAATLDASNIPLALIESAFPKAAPYLHVLPREISALSIEATGMTRSPNYLGSINLSNPESTVRGTAPSFSLDRVRSGAITLASITPDSPKVLTVNDLAAFKNGHLVATLSGTLPNLSGFLARTSLFQAGATLPEQDLHADLKLQDLSALSLLSPSLLDSKKTAGQLSASINFGSGGLSGLVTLTNGSVGLTNFETAVNKINGIVVLANNKAVIQNFTGISSKGGGFALTGGGDLAENGGVNAQFVAKDLIIDEGGKQSALYENFNSTLKAKINGALTLAGPWLTPTLATPPGAPLVVSDATATLPAATGTSATPGSPPRFDPRFNVAVKLGTSRSKTISVRSSLLKADADGNVRLTGQLSEPRLHAGLTVERGQFILPPSTLLKIVKPAAGVENTVQLDYPVSGSEGVPGLQTQVDLTAQATISVSSATLAQYRSVASAGIGESAPLAESPSLATSSLGGQSQRYTITAHIHGILNDANRLTLDLESSPGDLSRQQMLAALVPAGSLLGIVGGGGNSQNQLETQFKTAFSQVVIPTVLSPITDAIGSFIGADLNVDYDPNLPLFVTVVKQVGPRLDVTFSRAFGTRGPVDQTLQPPQYQIKLGYSLNRRLQIGIATDDQHDNTVSLDGVFRF